ncbi:cytochrome b/b6 domain-containing protein [Patulibacter minatonensis]|uniref:cytochrome b/b6 domain-containing protein n=1 Tax=Patulibacter minatonensis TaxID=298163 RepID=UPI00047AB049|nr:cytochrome b/b6 domain-containing protein [Patulibacter minatonensis]
MSAGAAGADGPGGPAVATAPPVRGPAPAQTFPAGARVHRFGGSERAVHWIHAAAFFVLTGSGLVMYLPALSERVGDRPTLKAIHLTAAVLWVTALAVVAILGDRPALREAVRELERFDDDDRNWLLRRGRPRGWRRLIPQGRFNAAEKAHAVVQAALAVLFVLSGVLLWLGERDTTFRLPGTVALHDASMYVAVVLVLGHLYLALLHPPTRPALRGILRGDVDAAWAREHHRKWDAAVVGDVAPDRVRRPGAASVLAAVVAVAAGLAVVVLVVL